MMGRLGDAPVMGASNPGRFSVMPGGAGLNTASTAAALGLDCTLVGRVGDDGHARLISAALAERGLRDRLSSAPGRLTDTYTSILAPDGELVIALAQLDLVEELTGEWLAGAHGRDLDEAQFWFLSANLNARTVEQLVHRKRDRFVAAACVSPAKAGRLAGALGSIDLLFANRREAVNLIGAVAGSKPDAETDGAALAEAIAGFGVHSGIVTDGAGPVVAWDGKGAFVLGPPPAARVVDVTGAGDALAGAVLAARAKGLGFEEAVASGVAAARLVLAVDGPYDPQIDWPALEDYANGMQPTRLNRPATESAFHDR